MKNIAMILSHSELAGGERVAFDLCERLSKSEFNPIVILPKEGGLSKKFQAIGIETIIISFRRDMCCGYPPSFRIRSARALLSALAKRSIHLLHIHDSYLTLFAGWVGRKLNIPVALTAHGPWDAHFLYQDVLNRVFLKRIWTPASAVVSALRRRHLIPINRLRVIPFGVDTEKFRSINPALARRQLGILSEQVVIIRVARFDSAKDYPTFLASAERLVNLHPNIVIVVLGDTILNIPSEAGSNKQAFLDFLNSHSNLRNHVRYLGHQDEVAPFIDAADILVSSSVSESFPINILEGMSMGRPIVSTNVGSVSDMVIDGETGILVRPGDPMALADATSVLVDDPKKRDEMGNAARARVQRFFDLTSYVKSMENEYREILQERIP